MEIRPFTMDDIQAVSDLWNLTFPDSPDWNDHEQDMLRKLTIQQDLFLVAVEKSRIVGTAMAGFDGHRGWVYYVAVDPEVRHRGIGVHLMARVEKELKNLGCTKLNLQVRATNEDAVAFYKKIGYKIEERISMGKVL